MLGPMSGSERKWSVGDAVIVGDPDAREYGHEGTITAITRNGNLSVRMAGWSYAVFAPDQLNRAASPVQPIDLPRGARGATPAIRPKPDRNAAVKRKRESSAYTHRPESGR